LASGNFSGTHRISAWWYVAWLAWFLCVALVMHFTQARGLSGEVAFWWTVSLAVAAGALSVPLLSRPHVAHLLILVPVWLFGAWFSLLSPWFPSFGIFGFFPWIGAFLLYLCSLIVAGIVWDWARRRGRA
jgi:hypothetical protein